VLEERTLLAISVELNGGTIPIFTGDSASDTLTLRLGVTGNIEYSANGGAFFLADLDSDAGTQSLLLANATRIDVSLQEGNDVLTIDFANGNPIPSGGVTFDGGLGIDCVVSVRDTSFTLSDTSLSIASAGNVTLTSVELAQLTGGAGQNTLNASSFSGGVTLDGGAGDDLLYPAQPEGNSDSLIGGTGIDRIFRTTDRNVDLSNTRLDLSWESGGVAYGLLDANISGIEEAVLTGGTSANDIDVTQFSGSTTLTGGAGNDTLRGSAGTDLLSESGDVSFTLTNSALVGLGTDTLISIDQASLTGGSGNNSIDASGFAGPVTLDGGSGIDTLTGGSGADQLTGGLGNDSMTGGSGTDILVESGDVNFTLTNTALTGLGSDTLTGIEVAKLTGGAGNNTLNASAFTGSVTLDGGSGNDTLTGGSGADQLTGGLGNDSMTGGSGTDILVESGDINFTLTNTALTGLGSDTITGIEVAKLTGGAGNNTLNASAFTGSVTIDGGSGDDSITGGLANDSLVGGTGVDTLVLAGDVSFTLTSTSVTGLGTDSLNSLDQASLTGGGGNNTIDASAFTGSVTLDGGSGNDTLIAGAGADQLTGGLGNDSLTGGSGTDTLVESGDVSFTLSNTTLSGMGSDTLTGIEAAKLTGGAGNNSLAASTFTGSATLDGGAGNDSITGGLANDSLVGGTGIDVLIVAADVNITLTTTTVSGVGTDALSGIDQASLTGGAGNNLINASGFAGPVTIDGGAGNDTLSGGSASDSLIGGTGTDRVAVTSDVNQSLSDTLLMGLGSDTLSSIEEGSLADGANNSVLDASLFTGPVTLSGGSGNDSLIGGSGADVLTGGLGDDTINGASGTDRLSESGDVNYVLTDTDLIGLGTDVLMGIEQATLVGGSGSNSFTVSGWTGAVTLDGGSGNDQVVVINDANITLTNTTLTRSMLATISLTSIELASLTGGGGANVIDASAFTGAVTLDGAAGNDTLLGGSSNDWLQGGDGNDSMVGGSGTDRVIQSVDAGQVLTSTSLSGLGTDTLSGIEEASLVGGVGNNALNATSFTGPVTLDGGDGNDTLTGGSSGDQLTGGLGNDSLTGGTGTDTIVELGDVSFTLSGTSMTGLGTDTLSGIEQAKLTGGIGANVFDITGWTNSATLDGGYGDDRVVSSNDANFTLSNSTLTRSTGGTSALMSIEQAVLTGGASANTLNAATFTGSVTLDGGSGNDTITGGTNTDSLVGGVGVDRVIASGDVSYNLSPTSLSGLGDDLLTAIEEAVLTGGTSANSFTVSGWTGVATLDGGSGVDRVVSSNNSSYTLTNALLTQGNGGSFTLTSFEEASLTGDVNSNSINASAFSGATTLSGGSGNDTLTGGSGADTVLESSDVSFTLTNTSLTGLGTDVLVSIERASLTGGSSNNTLNASAFTGAVTLDGGLGADSLVGGSASDILTGGAGAFNDTITGGSGTDTLVESGDANYTLTSTSLTGLGTDVLSGIEQANLTGGIGSNSFTVSGWTGAATVDGGDGDDQIISSNDANFTLSNSLLTRSSGGTFVISHIETAYLVGGSGANTLNASTFTGSTTLDGGLGADSIVGGTGPDLLSGGLGNTNDTLSGGDGDDTLSESDDVNFTLTDSSLTGGLGTDLLSGIEQAILVGGANPKTMNASGFSGSVTLDGGNGQDTITGGPNADVLTGGLGADVIDGGSGSDTLVETEDKDYVLTDTSLVIGTNSADALSNIEEVSLVGGASANVFTITGWTGPASLDGGAGVDRVISSNDDSFILSDTDLTLAVGGTFVLISIEEARLTGGASANGIDATDFSGATTLDGGSGNDTLFPGSGNDSVIGGAGTDLLVVSGDVSFSLSNGSLSGLGADTLSQLEEADIIGGDSANIFTVSGWTGSATLEAGGGTDRVVSVDNADFTLTGSLLTRSTGGTFSLLSIEEAELTGGSGNNTITASGFAGPVTLNGSSGADSLTGGSAADVLTGDTGNDTINGGGGTDTLFETGNVPFILTNSSLTGGLGTDVLSSIEQAILIGGADGKTLDASGFSGPVTIDGGGGIDTITGGSGADFLTGGIGNDVIDGGTGTDTLVESGDVSFTLTSSTLTGLGSDTISNIERASLTGGAGNNTITAATFTGSTTLDGGGGNDSIVGGTGADLLIGGLGNDTISGGTGTDILKEISDVSFTLTSTALTGLGTDTLSGIEQAILTGGTSNNVLDASAFSGSVTLNGGSGDDTLLAGSSNDWLTGGDGNDSITGGAGTDRLVETTDAVSVSLTPNSLIGIGTDVLSGIEEASLTGGVGNNSISAATFTGPTTLWGGDGDDTLASGTGNDSLDGGNGNDTFLFGSGALGSDTISDAAGLDTLDFDSLSVITPGTTVQLNIGVSTLQNVNTNLQLTLQSTSSIDVVIGSAGNDLITGNGLNNTLLGGGGDDTLDGDAGNDTTYDGLGNDQVIASTGAERIYRLAGTDIFTSGSGTYVLGMGVGDFNGDGRNDVVARESGTNNWQVELTTETASIQQTWGTASSGPDWDKLIIGDFTGDGRDDVAGRNLTDGKWYVAVSTGTSFNTALVWDTWNPAVTWRDPQAGDFNGDGRDDLVGRNEATGELFIGLSSGTSFASQVWGTWTAGASEFADVRVGDFNGDSREDIVARTLNSNPNIWKMARSTGTSFTTENWGNSLSWSDVQVGDFNLDGKSDLVGHISGSSNWWAAISTGSALSNQDMGSAVGTHTWQGIEIVDFGSQFEAAIDAFEFVRNNVELQVYPGMMKGGQATLDTLGGNDWDQAALLIQLLNADGISARYAVGRIDVTPEEAMRWLGAKDLTATNNILSQMGWHLDFSPFQFDHVWVQASLPSASGFQWFDLDPSWKFKDRQPGVSGIMSSVPFDENDYLLQPRKELTYEYYEDQVAAYLAANKPGTSLADVPYDGPIIPEIYTAIPSLPYTVDGTPDYYNPQDVSALNKHRVQLTLTGTAGLLLSMPEDGLTRVTVSYAAAGGNNVVPQLRVDGQVVATGTAIARGNPVTLTLEHLDPGQDLNHPNEEHVTSTYVRSAGQYLAIGFDALQHSTQLINKRRRDLNTAILAIAGAPADPGEAVVGTELSLALTTYYHDFGEQATIIDGLTGAVPLRFRVGSGVATGEDSVEYHWDLSLPVVPNKMFVDLKNNHYQSYPQTGLPDFTSTDAGRRQIVLDDGSALEHATIESLTNGEGVSTIKGFQLAHQNGIPFFVITEANDEALMPQLTVSQVAKKDIQNAIDAHFTVTVPRDPIRLPKWVGAVWISERSTPGKLDFGYQIEGASGQVQGGVLAAPINSNPNTGNSALQSSDGDPVNVANGNMFHDDVDIALPGVGLPLLFARHYDSRSLRDVGFGPGWTHSYADVLTFGKKGVVTWITNEGFEYTFVRSGGTYSVPVSLHGTFVFANNVYTFRNKDGLKHEFNKKGKLIAISDRNGNKLVVAYDGKGRITTVTDSFDSTRKLTFVYNLRGHIQTIQDFTGRSWTYLYIPLSNPKPKDYLTKVASPLPSTMTYDYFSGGRLHGLLKNIIDPTNGVHQYSYYPNRQAFEVTDANGYTTHDWYNPFRSLTTFVNEREEATTYLFDKDGLTLRQTNPDRTRDVYTWQNSLMVSWKDTFGVTETYEFFPDGLGNLKRTVDRAGVATDFTYDPTFSMVTSVVRNATGTTQERTTFSYDGAGNLTDVTDAASNRTTMAYYSRGELKARTLPKGNVALPDGNYTTTYTYNGAGQVLTEQTGLPSTVTNTYDTRGNVSTTTDATNVTTTYTYDLLGRRLTKSLPDPDGGGGPLGVLTSSYTYDAIGQLQSVTDPRGNTTSFVYDQKHQQIQAINPDLTFKTVAYDPAGNIRSSTDELGRTTQLVYDSRDRPIQVIQPDGAVDRTRYDGGSRRIASTDALGHATSYSYDSASRLAQTTDAKGNSTTNTYDEFGNLETTTNRRGATTTYTYDLLNRPTQERGPEGFVSTNDYDPNGNVTLQVRYDVAGLGSIPDDPRTLPLALQRRYETTYDVLNRPTKVTNPNPDPALNHRDTTYDAAGRVRVTSDELTRETHYDFDLAGRQYRITGPDPDGAGSQTAITTLTLDGSGNVVSTEDPLNRVTQYTYDKLNRRVTETLPAVYDGITQQNVAPVNRFAFDAAGQLVTSTDALGRMTISHYDARGRIVRNILPDPDGLGSMLPPVTQSSYDSVGNRTSVTDPLGRTTSYSYDALNRLVEEALPALTPSGPTIIDNGDSGFGTSGTWLQGPPPDGYGNDFLYATSGGSAATATWTFTGLAHGAYQVAITWPAFSNFAPSAPVTILNDTVELATFTIDQTVAPTGVSDAGATWQVIDGVYLIDSGTLKVRLANSGGGDFTVADAVRIQMAPKTYAYDQEGNLTSSGNELGFVTAYIYDLAGRKIEEVLPDPDGVGSIQSSRIINTYDALGNLKSSKDAQGHTMTYEYDVLGRVIKETSPDPDGTGLHTEWTSFTYDAVGNLKTSSNRLNETTQYDYDVRNLVTRTTDPRTTVTTYVYDAAGNRTRIIDPSLNGTTFVYDNLNRLITETNEMGNSRTIVYDLVGNALGTTDRNGRKREFTYDALNRQTVERWMNGGATLRAITSTYDAGNQLTAITDPDSSYAYTYDARGRLLTVSNSGTSGVPTVVWSYTYDTSGNQLSRSSTINTVADATNSYQYDGRGRLISVQQSGSGISSKRIDFAYNLNDQFTTITRYADLAATQVAVQSTYTYDLANRLTGITHSQGTTLASYTYQFDNAGRISQATSSADSNGGSSTFSYDADGQLTGATHAYQTNESYSYDATGNRTNSGYQTGLTNRVTSDGVYTYLYDNEGNRTRRTKISTGAYDEYTWDYRNRLTQVASKTSGGTLTQQVDYTYDVFDRRISRTLDPDGVGSQISAISRFVYDDDDIALAFENTGGVTNRYVYGPNVDQILADGSQLNGLLWPLADHESSVRDLVKLVGSTTQVQNHIVYDTFGRVISETAPTIDHLFSYTGRERDEATGLYNYRARWYDPAVGRFASEDPVGFSSGDVNLFRYVGNSSVNAIDPSGLTVRSPLWNFSMPKSATQQLIDLGMPARTAETLLPQGPFSGEPWFEAEFQRLAAQQRTVQPDASTGWPGASPDQLQRLDAARNVGWGGWIGQKTGFVETPELVVAEIQMERDQWLIQRAFNLTQQQQSSNNPLLPFFDANREAAQPFIREDFGMRLSQLNTVLMVTGLGEAALEARALAGESRTLGALIQSNAASTSRLSFPELQVLNREFVPDGTRVLQNLTNSVNQSLGSNLRLATTVLSREELDAAAYSTGLARAQYGNALERLVAREIKSDPMLSSLYRHVGGPSNPDFIGRGLLNGMNFDITTPGQAAAHLARPGYGKGLNIITYERPPGFP
jgi:RHS repeat-associated protein